MWGVLVHQRSAQRIALSEESGSIESTGRGPSLTLMALALAAKILKLIRIS
jgi:hypothetical protein